MHQLLEPCTNAPFRPDGSTTFPLHSGPRHQPQKFSRPISQLWIVSRQYDLRLLFGLFLVCWHDFLDHWMSVGILETLAIANSIAANYTFALEPNKFR